MVKGIKKIVPPKERIKFAPKLFTPATYRKHGDGKLADDSGLPASAWLVLLEAREKGLQNPGFRGRTVVYRGLVHPLIPKFSDFFAIYGPLPASPAKANQR